MSQFSKMPKKSKSPDPNATNMSPFHQNMVQFDQAVSMAPDQRNTDLVGELRNKGLKAKSSMNPMNTIRGRRQIGEMPASLNFTEIADVAGAATMSRFRQAGNATVASGMMPKSKFQPKLPAKVRQDKLVSINSVQSRKLQISSGAH